MMTVKNAANIRARFHGPTDTQDSRFVVSWRGNRLGVYTTDSLTRDRGDARRDHVLALRAAEAYRSWREGLYAESIVTIESVTIGDNGPNEYSIHVVVKES